MTLLSRRSILRLLGMLVPGFAASQPWLNARAASGATLLSLPDGKAESYAAISEWLAGHRISLTTLDRLDGGRSRPTGDIRQSFRDDPLVNSGGLLLPIGFCRYCLSRSLES